MILGKTRQMAEESWIKPEGFAAPLIKYRCAVSKLKPYGRGL
jgi:hypothetical protein